MLFAFVKNVVQIAFSTQGCCKAVSVSHCGSVECGAVKHSEMTSLLPGHTLGCESGILEPEIGLEHNKRQNLHGAGLQKQLKTALILSVTFI